MIPPQSGQPAPKHYWLAFRVVALTMITSLWVVPYLPLVDMPNHMGRVYTLAHYHQFEIFSRTFVPVFWPFSDAGFDLLTFPLLLVFDPMVAIRIELTCLVLAFATACHRMAQTIQGRTTWLAIPTIFFLFNSMFFYGYMSFHLALTVSMFSLIYWLRFYQGWTWKRWLIVSLLTECTFLFHLAPFSFLCAAYVMLQVLPAPLLRLPMAFFQKVLTRQFWISLAPLLPPVLTYLAVRLANKPPEEASYLEWPTIQGKALHTLVLLRSYDVAMDIAMLAGLLVAAFCLFRWARITLNHRFLMLSGVFWVLFLVFPKEAATGSDVDTRYVIPAVLFGIYCMSVEIPRRIGTLVFLLVLGLSLLRVGTVTRAWWLSSQVLKEQLQLVSRIEPQSRVMPIIWMPQDSYQAKIERAMYSAPYYSVFQRNAVVAGTFAIAGHSQMQFREPEPVWPHWPPDQPLAKVDWPTLYRSYDYVWTYRVSEEYLRHLEQSCDVAERRGHGTLFKVRRSGSH
jgi:hypothetical protein